MRAWLRRAGCRASLPADAGLDFDAALPVVELAHVVVADSTVDAFDAEPAQEDVAGGLHQPLAHDDSRPCWACSLSPTNRASTEASPPSIAETTDPCRPGRRRDGSRRGADAPDAHNLACTVDVVELLDRVVVVRARDSPVLLDEQANRLLRFAGVISGGVRSSTGTMSGGSATILSSPSTSSARFAKTRVLSRVPRLRDAFSACVASFLRDRFAATSARTQADHLLDVQVVVPGIERPHACRSSHHGRGTRKRSRDDRTPVVGSEAAVATEDLDACGETLHVPLPRPGKCLVEVVDVEYQLPLG